MIHRNTTSDVLPVIVQLACMYDVPFLVTIRSRDYQQQQNGTKANNNKRNLKKWKKKRTTGINDYIRAYKHNMVYM
jgi:hypothetical protein